MKIWLAIFLGGGAGSLARYAISRLVLSSAYANFPLATFAANALSCICLGGFVLLINRYALSPVWFGLLVIGFCGGFSTFSTFSFENLILIQSGKWGLALANIGVSVVTCVAILAWILKPAQ